jgi:lysophospholipase L1-like esterase
MNKKFTSRLIKILLLSAAAFLLLVGILAFLRTSSGTSAEDLAGLENSEYNGIYISYAGDVTVQSEWFANYLGLTTYVCRGPVDRLKPLLNCLNAAYASNNRITHVFLDFDPALLLREKKDPSAAAVKMVEMLAPYFTAHPDVLYQIRIPAHPLSYWEELSSPQNVAECYGLAAEFFCAQPNVVLYFYGDEDWVLYGENQFADSFSGSLQGNLNEKFFLYTYADRQRSVSAGEMDEKCSRILAALENPKAYPDLTGTAVVCIGDSIFGNYSDTTSITSVMNALSGCSAYNCAVGGATGAANGHYGHDFPTLTAMVGTGDATVRKDFADAQADILDGGNLIFVIEFGINDYFNGYAPVSEDPADTATTVGSLRTGITELASAHPEAQIILMIPGYISRFDNGWAPSDESRSWVLEDYRAAIRTLGDELGCTVFEQQSVEGLTQDTFPYYAEDDVHYNERGRFLMAEALLKTIQGDSN